MELVLIDFFNGNCFSSYIGRPTAASPATGSKAQHLKELANLLDDAMAI